MRTPGHAVDAPIDAVARADAVPDTEGDILEGPRGSLVPIEDPGDVRLAEYRDLNDPASRRRVEAEEAIFVVEGRLAVRQLLRSSYEVQSLLIDDHQVAAGPELVEAVRARGAPVYVGRREVVAATVGFALHRGVVAVARRPANADADRVLADAVGTPSVGGGSPLLAVLEGLNDHENIGAMFRNAAAFGVAAVLLDPTCGDPLYRRSVRVSVGHVLHVPFARLAPWPRALDQVRAAGFLVAALAPAPQRPGAGGPTSVPLPQLAAELADPARRPGTSRLGSGARPVALVLGAEGPGLSAAVLDAADVIVSIAMAKGVDSLNVAAAAAIAFHRLSNP